MWPIMYIVLCLGMWQSVLNASSPIPYTVLESEGSLTISLTANVGVSEAAKNLVLDQWRTEVGQRCGGAFVGRAEVQITARATHGEPFADPIDESTERYITGAFGKFRCNERHV
jgi:hypothetical protein